MSGLRRIPPERETWIFTVGLHNFSVCQGNTTVGSVVNVSGKSPMCLHSRAQSFIPLSCFFVTTVRHLKSTAGQMVPPGKIWKRKRVIVDTHAHTVLVRARSRGGEIPPWNDPHLLSMDKWRWCWGCQPFQTYAQILHPNTLTNCSWLSAKGLFLETLPCHPTLFSHRNSQREPQLEKK